MKEKALKEHLRNLRPTLAFWILAALLIIVFFGALCAGRYPLSLKDIFEVFLHKLTGCAGNSVYDQVVWSLRLPRILLAGMTGAALAVCGASLQGLFRNPLVDPKVIGVSSAAGFGGTMAIMLGLETWGLMGLTFVFGMASLVFIFYITCRFFRSSLLMLVLAGLILGGLFSALISLMQFISDSEEVLPTIVFWLMGSFATANWWKTFLFFMPFVVFGAILFGLRWRLNLLALDDKNARALGINIQGLRWMVLLSCGVLVSAQVALTGGIGWVDLVLPHIGRMVVGSNHQKLIPACFFIGAIFMIVIDTLARTISSAEIPISILTAAVGAPVFAFILFQLRTKLSHE